MAAQDDEQLDIPLAWIGVEELPMLGVNQMIAQHIGREEFILIFGQVAPPVILGQTEEQRREQLRMVTFAAVKPVARVSMTRARVVELIRILHSQLEAHDSRFGGDELDDDGHT
jgi:hypothetical protein